MNLIKIVNIFFIALILILLPFGFTSYTGNKIYYLIFTLISSYALLTSFKKDSISFESFFSILMWLGFWFKFTVQISFLNSLFPEGAGIFDYRPNSYDQVLLIASVSIIAFISARIFRLKFIFNYENFKTIKYNNDNYLGFYSSFRKIIIISYLIFVIFFSITNFIFVFFQKGMIPTTILPLGLNNFINWLLMFGLTTFSSLLIYFEFLYKKKNSNILVKYGLFETFISSISVLSRAMIFNGTAIIYGFYRLIEFDSLKIKKSSFIKYFFIIFILFMMSLLIVSKLRQSKDFPVGHQVHTYLPTVETKIVDGVEKKPSSIIKMTNDLTKEINQIIFLVAGRWVGIEGVMAVYANKDLNFSSFITSFNDEFDYSNSFYENTVKRSKHTYKKSPKIFTVYVPGIVAFLFYTNSLIFLFFGIFLLCIFCSVFELLAYKISRGNIIFSYVIGNVLAYRLVHFGYLPQNSYKLILAICMNLIFMYLLFKIIKLFLNK